MLAHINIRNRHLLLAFLGLALLCTTTHTVMAQDEELEIERDALQKALEYQNKVYQWFAEAHPPQEEFYRRLYQPILDGNKDDYDKNLRLMERMRERAKDYARKGMDETAEKYSRVAKLFYDLAQANRQIVNALLEKESKLLEEGFEIISTTERDIMQITGKRPKREWFSPDELRAAQQQAIAEKQK